MPNNEATADGPDQPPAPSELDWGLDFTLDPGDIDELAADLEDAAEDARKDVFEAELDDRVEPGETVGDLRKQTGRNTWIADTEGALAAVADAGIDPMEVASVSISSLRDALGDAEASAFIGESEYSYFRRHG